MLVYKSTYDEALYTAYGDHNSGHMLPRSQHKVKNTSSYVTHPED